MDSSAVHKQAQPQMRPANTKQYAADHPWPVSPTHTSSDDTSMHTAAGHWQSRAPKAQLGMHAAAVAHTCHGITPKPGRYRPTQELCCTASHRTCHQHDTGGSAQYLAGAQACWAAIPPAHHCPLHTSHAIHCARHYGPWPWQSSCQRNCPKLRSPTRCASSTPTCTLQPSTTAPCRCDAHHSGNAANRRWPLQHAPH